jgi:GT2 family glycosyltransferase
MMVSRKCLEAVGGFDERFYMYGEDLDLCRRGREAGFKVWYYPATGCVHYKGQSSKKAPTKSLYAFHHAMWLYYDKWYRHQTGIIADIIIYLAIWARFYLKVFINAFRKDKYVSK